MQRKRSQIASTVLWLVAWGALLAATACQLASNATPFPTAAPTVETTVTPSPAGPTPTTLSPNKMGVHLLLDDGRNRWPLNVWPAHMQYARQAVGEWGYVTQLVRLDNLDPGQWQVFMDLCAELHLTPIMRLATTFDRKAGWWNAPPPDDDGSYRAVAARYADFVTALEWPTSEHYIIVGNEPNHGNEWGGRPDPAAYARFLIEVSDALHKTDPEAYVLNAGLDPFTPNTGNYPFTDGMYYLDEETFLDQMHAAYPEVFDHVDVWASHAYPLGPLTEGPWLQEYAVGLLNDAANPGHAEPPLGVHNRGINGYEWELFKLSSYGVPPPPVMVTETGWRHAETTNPEATDGGHPLPDAVTTAKYLDVALHGNEDRYPDLPEEGWTPWLTDPRIIAVTPFALDGLPAEWGHTNWLALDSQGSVLGTYAPFELLAAGRVPPPNALPQF